MGIHCGKAGLLVGAIALILTACQPVQRIPEAMTPFPMAALPSEEQALVNAAVQFVAQTLDIAPEMLYLESIEAVQWPDASLGCPQPDMVYAAVITPGYLVILSDGARTYAVHTDSRIEGEKIICEQK